MDKCDLITELLIEIKQDKNGFIVLCMEDYRENRNRTDLIEYMNERGLLKEQSSRGMFRVSALGQDVLDAGGYCEWLKLKDKNTLPSIHIGHNITGNNTISGSNLNATNTHASKEKQNSILMKIIIGVIIVIVGAFFVWLLGFNK